MRKILLFLALIACSSAMSAPVNYQYCNTYSVDVEFLYLHPSFDDLFFVIDSDPVVSPNLSGTRKANHFNLCPGGRVDGAHLLCDGDEVHLRWTRLQATHQRGVSGANVVPSEPLPFAGPEGNPGTITSDVKFNFNSVDGFYQTNFLTRGSAVLNFFMGLQGAILSMDENITYFINGVGDIGYTDYHQTAWGIGPELGVKGNICLPLFLWSGNLSIQYMAWGSLLGSKLDTKFSSATSTSGVSTSVKNDSLWKIVPAWHARMGIVYEWCIASCNPFGERFSLEIGYEFTSYRQILAKLRFLGFESTVDLPAVSINNYSNFDMQGPYIAAKLAF